MKLRYGQLLNDLNITFETAIERLREAGALMADKDYSLNSVVSDEEYLVLLHSNKKRKGCKGKSQPQKKASTKGHEANSNHPSTYKKMVTAPCGFTSCYSYFMLKAESYKQMSAIKQEMDKVFGENAKAGDFRLARVPKIKGIKVAYKYYYYSQTGRRSYIKDENKCLLTWMASVFSEAVNKELITKADYHSFFMKYLAPELVAKKKRKFKSPKMSHWVSIVSVPFGGMNKR